ncbi:MAG: [LysW]-aminoadipate kinase [Phototrophicaceae bacterium]
MENLLVVKLGGGVGLDMPRACRNLAEIARERPLIVVHGVSARMNQLCEDLNVPVRTLSSPTGHSSRYTDERTRDIFVTAARSVNDDICEWLSSYGANPISVADEVVISGTRKKAIRAVVDGRVRIVRDDYSGSISGVDGDVLRDLLAQGRIPVVPPMAFSDSGYLNIDGDRASAAIAAELQADTLLILSNVDGLYRDFEADDAPISTIYPHQLEQAMDWAQGRMKRKVLGAQEALNGGVGQVIIGDGRISDAVSEALNGAGTHFLSTQQISEAQ